MLTMILQMTGVTALYVTATAMLWRYWHQNKDHSLLLKLAVGLFYGLCSIAANHFGIVYGNMILNVRDIGPLAAGLFFDPVAGILSGLIGGIERFIIGEYFEIGYFTRVACSLSTCLAGILAAVLHLTVYQGKRPSVIHCLLLGAGMEVFHMYAVFLTNRNDMTTAYYVVEICAFPMITFTALGLVACSVIITLMTGSKLHINLRAAKRNTPLDSRFQRWLMVVTVFLFSSSLLLSYSLLTNSAYEDHKNELLFQRYQYQESFRQNKNLTALQNNLNENNYYTNSLYLLVNAERLRLMTWTGNGKDSTPIDPDEVAIITENADGDVFETDLKEYFVGKCMCISARLDDIFYLLIATPEELIYKNRESQMKETLFLEILLFTAMYLVTSMMVERMIVRNLDKVNQSLGRITAGHLNESVEVEESAEFTKLSAEINTTVIALRGYIDAAENRMKEELKLAAAIQDAALPKNFNLPTNHLEVYALMTPARSVGGDFYDFFYVGMDQIALVIADVSGKGIPASLFMMRAKTAIKNTARNGLGPAKILENVNNMLCEGNDAEMFVTVWLGILDMKTGLMRCANAGHEYPALMRAGSGYELLKDKHGLVLAGYENVTMKEYEITLNPGDRLFVYTDGVPEAVDERNEQFGTGRMTEELTRRKDGSQEILLKGMLEAIRNFAGEAEQFDDITMLGITYR